MAKLSQLSDITVEGVENAIVVAPGPSLEKNIHILRDHQEQFLLLLRARCWCFRKVWRSSRFTVSNRCTL